MKEKKETAVLKNRKKELKKKKDEREEGEREEEEEKKKGTSARLRAASMPSLARESVRAIITKSLSFLAATAVLILSTISSVLTIC